MALQPSAVLIVREWFAQNPKITDIVATRVHANRMPRNPAFPLVMVRHIASTPIAANGWFAATRIQIEGYGADLYDSFGAYRLAATLQEAVYGIPGWEHPEGVVSGVTIDAGIQDQPDTDVQRARYMFDARVFMHPRVHGQLGPA